MLKCKKANFNGLYISAQYIISEKRIQLNAGQKLELSFSAENITYLETKGRLHYKKEQCKLEPNTNFWKKRLQDNFMKVNNITCKPTISMNVFEFSSLDECTIEEEAHILKEKLNALTDFQMYCPTDSKDCLPKCSDEVLLDKTEASSESNNE